MKKAKERIPRSAYKKTQSIVMIDCVSYYLFARKEPYFFSVLEKMKLFLVLSLVVLTVNFKVLSFSPFL